MRWRLVDRIDAFESWTSIAGRKCASFEECGLLEALGREGALPEVLILECLVELGRWLVAASSEFRETACLRGIERFTFDGGVGPGETLCCRLRVTTREPRLLRVDGELACERRSIGRGSFALQLGLRGQDGPERGLRELWEKLHEPASRSG